MDKLTESDIKEYCENFYGYGNINSDILVVGLEEGFGIHLENEKSFSKKVSYVLESLRRDKNNTVDFLELHKEFAPEQIKKIEDGKEFSPFWIRLVSRVIMGINEKKINNSPSDVVEYFKNVVVKNYALLEFGPLPCTSLDTWKYKEYECTRNIYELNERKNYIEWIEPLRIKKIKDFIETNNYKAVLFCGKSYRSQWEKIIDTSSEKLSQIIFEKSNSKRLQIEKIKKDGIGYYLIPQPGDYGITNDFYDWVGCTIKENINK